MSQAVVCYPQDPLESANAGTCESAAQFECCVIDKAWQYESPPKSWHSDSKSLSTIHLPPPPVPPRPLLLLLLHIQLTQPTTLFHICHLLYLSATPCSFCPFSFCPTTAPTLLFSASSVRSCTLCVTHSKRRAPPSPHSSGTSVPCFCNITSRSHLLSLLPVDCPDRSKLRIRVVRRCAAARVARRSPPRSFGTQSTRTRLTPRPLDRSRTLNLPESSIPTTTPSPQTTAKRTCQTT